MRDISIDLVAHAALSAADLHALRRLFDAEYLQDFGEWNPDQPYGYAPHDVHLLARRGPEVLGHVGWARRAIRVGSHEVVVAGVGGVVVSSQTRGEQIGRQLMDYAAKSMVAAGGIDFGHLGCREAVVPFYSACGWKRISAAERSIDRSGQPAFDPPGQPLLILPVNQPTTAWPAGEVDLRGRAW